ncbi:MAG: DUF4148 domain-containing protein [Burkholderiaceae bacterium]
MKTSLIASAAFATLAAFGAHAESPDPTQQMAAQPTASATRADVQAQARTPWKIGNGGTGYEGLAQSPAPRAEVRAQAAAAVRDGTTPRGEM